MQGIQRYQPFWSKNHVHCTFQPPLVPPSLHRALHDGEELCKSCLIQGRHTAQAELGRRCEEESASSTRDLKWNPTVRTLLGSKREKQSPDVFSWEVVLWEQDFRTFWSITNFMILWFNLIKWTYVFLVFTFTVCYREKSVEVQAYHLCLRGANRSQRYYRKKKNRNRASSHWLRTP